MPDFHTLTDAFAELERRADAAPAESEPATPARHRNRNLLVAASVVGVAALATGSALLASGSDAPNQAPAAASQPATEAPAPPPTAPAPTTTASPVAPSPTGSPGFQVPQTARDLEQRFRAVLGDSATFTVTDTGHAETIGGPGVPIPSKGSTILPIGPGQPNGAAIVGVLTADGVSGGYDIQIFQSTAGAKAMCDDPDSSTCDVRRLDDGSSLATGREPLENNADGVTYQADLIRPDGVEFLMHVSNERDPKGESAVLAEHPPLSVDEMIAIVTSDRW